MRKKIVAGNWKMNCTLSEAQKLASEVVNIQKDDIRTVPANRGECVGPVAAFADDLNGRVGGQQCAHPFAGQRFIVRGLRCSVRKRPKSRVGGAVSDALMPEPRGAMVNRRASLVAPGQARPASAR